MRSPSQKRKLAEIDPPSEDNEKETAIESQPKKRNNMPPSRNTEQEEQEQQPPKHADEWQQQQQQQQVSLSDDLDAQMLANIDFEDRRGGEDAFQMNELPDLPEGEWTIDGVSMEDMFFGEDS